MGLGLCRLSWYLDEATLAISSLLVAFYTVVRWKIIIFPLSAKTDSWTGVILPAKVSQLKNGLFEFKLRTLQRSCLSGRFLSLTL
ncbi:unnamed protein product [Oikopleura dioica]|uniref:Uncharacterized protein n=1 Tax=Oikopleura dioica TaxID=34765 RepID=E4XGR4_OIKDI|nr:unnamed protein product [Oikopleura dioica]